MIMVVYFVLGTCTFIINNLPPSFIPPLLFISAFPPPPYLNPFLEVPSPSLFLPYMSPSQGWLPQSIIDQTLCGVMTGTFTRIDTD